MTDDAAGRGRVRRRRAPFVLGAAAALALVAVLGGVQSVRHGGDDAPAPAVGSRGTIAPTAFPTAPVPTFEPAPTVTGGTRLDQAEATRLRDRLWAAVERAGTVRTSMVFSIPQPEGDGAGATAGPASTVEKVLDMDVDVRDRSLPKVRMSLDGGPFIVQVGAEGWSRDTSAQMAGVTALAQPWQRGLAGGPTSAEDVFFQDFSWDLRRHHAAWRLPDDNGLQRFRLVLGRYDKEATQLNPPSDCTVVDIWVDPSNDHVTHEVVNDEDRRLLSRGIVYGASLPEIVPPQEIAPASPPGRTP